MFMLLTGEIQVKYTSYYYKGKCCLLNIGIEIMKHLKMFKYPSNFS